MKKEFSKSSCISRSEKPLHVFSLLLCCTHHVRIKATYSGWGDNMNKEFIKKMIKSEILRYQAIKEILPDNVKDGIDSFEKDVGKLLKDIALELVTENLIGQDNSIQSASNKTYKSEEKKSVKRVQVDFN